MGFAAYPLILLIGCLPMFAALALLSAGANAADAASPEALFLALVIVLLVALVVVFAVVVYRLTRAQ